MAKKRKKSKSSKKKTSRKRKKHKKAKKVIVQKVVSQEQKVDKVLMENFVSLQRVMTNLAVNVDNLSNRVSKLLEIFEISAKALAEKDFDLKEDSAELIEKLDQLADQNKILARGVALMHERMPREQYPPPPAQQMPPIPPAIQPMQPPQSYSYTKEVTPMQPSKGPVQKRTQETPGPPPSPTPAKKPGPRFESPVE